MRKGHGTVVGKIVRVVPRTRLPYAPGQLILRIAPDAVPAAAAPRRARRGRGGAGGVAMPEAVTAPLEYLRRNAGLRSVTPLFARRRPGPARATVSAAERCRRAVVASVAESMNEDLAGFTVVTIDPRKPTGALTRYLRGSRAIEIAEPMPARWLQAPVRAADPMQNLQWGLRAIRWFAAAAGRGGAVGVAVLDTGVDAGHPDLAGGIAAYEHAGLAAADVLGHGTHVCGIIGAAANNRVGIAGMAPCRLHVWKIFPDRPARDGEFYVDGERYLRALGTARAAGVRVMNLSIGGTASSETEQLLFRRLEAAGVVVVAAMGNEYEEGNPTEYPAAYETVLAVGAVAETLRRAEFSNTGRHIALVAPGANILSTLPVRASRYLDETEYAAWSGTSMATPHVAGAAALLCARHPRWTAAAVKRRLVARARRLAAMRGQRHTAAYGRGLLDVRALLR
jgi:subtilisin family serine protease